MCAKSLTPQPDVPAWKQSQREVLPERRVKPLAEAVSNWPELKSQQPQPTGGTVELSRGAIMRYWTNGSLRRA